MYRDASHLWRSFSHNRTKINIQFLSETFRKILKTRVVREDNIARRRQSFVNSNNKYSRTWDKKIPPEEGFLLFLSGTARACLLPRVAVWYRLSSTPFCSFTSVTMPSQRKAQRFPRRQGVPVTLKRTFLTCFSLKCISQRGTRKIIKSQCWIQTDKSQSRVIRCHIPVSATASTGICDIVSPSTEIFQSGSNTGTWFY